MKKKLNIILVLILVFLVLGNPSENRFLSKLSNDFGTIHHGARLGPSELETMGTSAYSSYLVFSRYEYTFGTIQVNYFGIGFMTFYLGSNTQELKKKESDKQTNFS